jgi:hypothetical protein
MHDWLKALRHDRLKRVLWPARDGGDLAALRKGMRELIDDEGRPIGAMALFERFRLDAPPGSEKACAEFAAALKVADAALDAPWPAARDQILALDPAFASLARAVERT